METMESAVATETKFDEAALQEAAQPFIGQWSRLVSTTNWEKGRIIEAWREALFQAGAPAAEYSDEAWSRRVGGVTGQHVGRLRRVWRRFGKTYGEFDSLYWSHFQAALDWDDAEMWLEGAVQSSWSVSQMRHQRWETLGGEEPQEEDVVAGELDEDFEPALAESPAEDTVKPVYDEVAAGPLHEGPDFGDEDEEAALDDSNNLSTSAATSGQPQIAPFADIPQLPDDLADAVEELKLAILRHKAANWEEVEQKNVLATLDGLKQLALESVAM